jgi:hypothetical protein
MHRPEAAEAETQQGSAGQQRDNAHELLKKDIDR